MLKAALNRAFHTDRVSSDMAWRKVKPFKRVDEAVVRYLTAAEARRLVKTCALALVVPKTPEGARQRPEGAFEGLQRPERSRLNAGRVALSTISRGLESILVLDLRLNLSIAPFKNGPRRSEAKAGDPKPRRPRSSPWRLDLDQWSRLLEAHAADDALHDGGRHLLPSSQ